MSSQLHPVLQKVTQTIVDKSQKTRTAYLQRMQLLSERKNGVQRLGCANVAHAFAAMPQDERFKVITEKVPNLAIVSAYNDMLSAHAPYAAFPSIIKDEALKHGATAQVAGGVPAMCDGITQGTPGMELSLFSRDIIAQSTAVALSHDVFDGAFMLGVCDKIVPGMLIGALHFGYLPVVFVPAGPMGSGLSNADKAKVRELAAQGKATRTELLDAELKAYHSAGTCTFYGTANSNQMLLEAMGLHVPGAAFIAPNTPLRELATRQAVRVILQNIKANGRFLPIGEMVDERCIVNAMVALLATGGSTNHLIHWVAVARAAGIIIDWNDFSDLSAIVPLLARVYPNGSADVNDFQAAGGTAFVIHELLKGGFMHANARTVTQGAMADYAHNMQITPSTGTLNWQKAEKSSNENVLRPADIPFSTTGGLKLLTGNLGRSVIKVSAVPVENHVVEAPARVFDSQEALLQAFNNNALNQDVVCVVRWQGPCANGMPELHKLTPVLAVLQGKGYKVALVTDGRMSGASGKIPAAIHVCPEAAMGGALAKVRDGDIIRLDARNGELSIVSDTNFSMRPAQAMPQSLQQANSVDLGRDLFTNFRKHALSAEEGACTWF